MKDIPLPAEYSLVYEVTETGENSGITNDTDAVKTVTVTVKDKGDGTLEATATSTTEKPATFTNTYHVDPTTASFPVKKFVEVPEGLDGPEKWSYKINVASNNGAPVAETMEGTVTNENDTADFGPFTYNKPGTYTYTVSETGTVAGVTNDPDAAGKTVTVTVTDKGDGTLEAKADSTTEKPLTFTNKYSTEPVQTTAELFKKVASMPPNTTSATFKFTLEETTEGVEADPLSGTVTATAATPAGEKGYAIDFGPLTFTEPGTHTYTLTEVIDDDLDGGWVVSGSPAENVKIVVSDNGEGKLVAEVTGATITNTFDTVSVPGQKTWNDKEYLEYEGYERPESITVNLLADGKKIDSVVVTPDEDGNWTFEFKDLPKYKNHGTEIVYSVAEEPVAGFEASTGELTYEIVNTPNRDDEDELNPTTIHLKKVDYLTPADEDGNKVGLAGAEFTLTSDKLDEPVVYTTNEDGMVDITFDVNGEYTLTETKAPEGYQLPADPALSYTIKVDKEFIKSVKLNKEKNVWTWIYDLIAGITADYDRETHTLTVSDTPIKTKITADKVWEDANNQDGKRPETLTYTLTGMAGDVTAYTNTQTVKVAADGTASYTWEDLATYYDGIPVEYAVTEAAVDEYETEIGDIVPNEDGTEYTVEITNIHEIDLTTVTVNKAWSDQDNKFKTRPEKVTVQLMADGKAYGEPVELTEADKWTYTWTELPANQEGKVAVPVEYTVKEVKEAGYTATYEISGDAEKGYTIAMTNTLEKYPVTVTKAFTGITEAKIPEDFVVTVTYAGTTVRLNTKTQGVVKSEDGLTYTWTIEDIPYGAEVSVAEENADVLGYIVTAGIPEAIKVTDDAAKNVLSITNKYEENFGNLEITKSVPQFNAASGKQTFVFSIVAELEGDKVYDGVETIDFTQAGTKTVKIEGKIPVGSKVTVTEVYSGASYELTVKDPQTTEIIPTAKGTAKVSFENKPDGEITTGYGVLNEYDYTGAEGWVHNKNKTDSAE